jgi:hypothetical protein
VISVASHSVRSMPRPELKAASRIAGLLVWSCVVFGAGYLYREHRLLNSARFVTTKVLTLSAGLEKGSLPAGSTLYSYGGPDEQPQFVLFVGTSALTSLKPQAVQHWLEVAPDVAYEPSGEE